MPRAGPEDTPEGAIYPKMSFIYDYLENAGWTPFGTPAATGIKWGALGATLVGSVYLAFSRGVSAVVLGFQDAFVFLFGGLASFNAQLITRFFGGFIQASQIATGETIAFNTDLGVLAYVAAVAEVALTLYIVNRGLDLAGGD